MKQDDFQKTIIEAIQDFRSEVKVELNRINENVKRVDQRIDDTRKEIRGVETQITGVLHLLRAHEDYKDLTNVKVGRF